MTYAPLKIRIYAFLFDYLIIVLYGIFVVGTISVIFRPFITPLFSNSPAAAELTGFFLVTLPTALSDTAVYMILIAVYLTAFIYFISPLMNKKRKTTYDWIAGTKVVR
ncbi:RDD family protein [Bacillus gobiensis]|uniref:Uncharacterized protein n=1 Tax=Bacillus gobiensis TaxID=1441095 RepID=A0A0M5J9H9_9BACI|nr:RDD family protein [Bacillus gobiensis]ALC80301.1 hypothetical protein AM592_00805 [Bacillus gobiensis]